MTVQLKVLESKVQADVIRVLEEALVKAKAGEITRVGIIHCYGGKEWGTTFSATDDCRIDAAMMMELAMRRLGFATK